MERITAVLVALASLCASALAEDAVTKDKVDAAPKQVAVLPVFSQLVMLSVPKGFQVVYDQTTNDSIYTREAVLDGETAAQWSQMITVTGAKGLAANPNLSAQSFVERLAVSFQASCPATFAVKVVGATKISGQDAYAIVAGCGSVQSTPDTHSESALIIAIKGTADYYTIRWAERGPPSSWPIALSEDKWSDRFKALSPIRVCPIIPGEAAPYPSCADQKKP
jgi:hypothetical protein